MLGISIVPPFIILSSLCLLPESPRWLLGKGRERDAFSVLCTVCSIWPRANERGSGYVALPVNSRTDSRTQGSSAPQDLCVTKEFLVFVARQPTAGGVSCVLHTIPHPRF